MPPGKLKLFYLYLVVIVLFGWLGLAISDSSPNHCPPQNNKKTFGDEPNFCHLIYDYWDQKPTIWRVGRIFTKKLDGESAFDLAEQYGLYIQEVSKNITHFGPILATFANLFKGKDRRCLDLLYQKIEESFRNIQDETNRLTQIIKDGIKDAADYNDLDSILLEYNTTIRTPMKIYNDIIRVLTNPKTINETHYYVLKKYCNDSANGIHELSKNLKSILEAPCKTESKSYHAKKGSKTYADTGCLLLIAGKITDEHGKELRHEFFKSFVLDIMHIAKTFTFCTAIKASELNVTNNTKELEKFVAPISKSLYEAIELVKNKVREKDIEKIKSRKDALSEGFKSLCDKLPSKLKNSTFWITELVEGLKDKFIALLHNETLVFADGTADYMELYCPKTSCFFLKNFCNMHIMYSDSTRTGMELYNNPISSIIGFNSDIEGWNRKINMSDPNITNILDNLVKQQLVQRYSADFKAAALFYKNGTNVNVAIKTQYVQLYFHRTISINDTIVKLVAPSNEYSHHKIMNYMENFKYPNDVHLIY
jgi:gas vesicle protein